MADKDSKDKLYSAPLAYPADFRFDESVANVFPDMINRSVPGYGSVIGLTGVIAAHYATDNSRIYDLGCSLGASTLSVRHQLTAANCSVVAIDSSEAMIDRCRQNLQADSALPPVELRCEDIETSDIRNASVVILNFTLQFIPPPRRDKLLARIYQGLNPGGALILAEKLRFDSVTTDELFTELHFRFKKANGYSNLEISQKRTALENVLFPETLEQHRQRLADCGFSFVDQWFQCLNFAALLAVK